MTRFLLVSADFVKTGGMDRANYALASYLAREGHEVHLVSHAAARELLAMANVVFHQAPRPLGSNLLGEQLLARLGRRWAARLSRDGARVLVNGGNCVWDDVNWVHYVHAAYRPLVCAGALRRLKGHWGHRLFLREERASLSRARVIIANSRRTRDDLVDLLGVPPARIRVIYPGVDGDRFRPPTASERVSVRQELGWRTNQSVVAFIGALGDRRKGFDVVLEAWRILCQDRTWDVKLAVIGLGAEAPLWKRRAAEMGLGPCIEFMGFRKDVPEIMKGCDALVAPSRYEAYGLGVQEALACGLPAVVSACAGVAERYAESDQDLSDLLLPDPQNVSDVVDRLRRWHSRREHYRAALAPLSQALRRHTWDDMAEAMTLAMGSN